MFVSCLKYFVSIKYILPTIQSFSLNWNNYFRNQISSRFQKIVWPFFILRSINYGTNVDLHRSFKNDVIGTGGGSFLNSQCITHVLLWMFRICWQSRLRAFLVKWFIPKAENRKCFKEQLLWKFRKISWKTFSTPLKYWATNVSIRTGGTIKKTILLDNCKRLLIWFFI